MLVAFGVWQWLLGVLNMKVFHADGSVLMKFSLMLPSASVLESTVSLSAPDMLKVSAASLGLLPPIWLEVGGLSCPSEVVLMTLLSSVTVL